jgi:photosystem II PsbY protein
LAHGSALQHHPAAIQGLSCCFLQVFKSAALSAVAGNMLLAGHASAATEVASIAGDARVGMLATLFVPLAGWVLFNIAGPAKNQVDQMRLKSVLIGGLGVSALLATAGCADAAQEVAAVAGDARVGMLTLLFVPLAGWVLYNIAGPAKKQYDQMRLKSPLVGGLGLAGLLATAGSADAAQEVAAVAGDARVGILVTLFIPLVGWVLFNISGPAFKQYKNMASKNANPRGSGWGGGVGKRGR